tara:strand:+ start:1189 stop:1779 length:591 start_codon:yes stop_codon:yes gene_type:complete
MNLKEVWNLGEVDLIKRAGFKPSSSDTPEYNIGLSLKAAFNEFHPAALDSYNSRIMASNASLDIKEQSLNLLNSIKEKSENFKTLLSDFDFDDNSDIGEELFNKISGDTDPEEEDTLRFYDFNIDMSINSDMFENVIGLLDELNTFFDILIGMLGASGKEKEPRSIGFSMGNLKEIKVQKQIIKNQVPRLQKLAGI